ncbi:hypothetical protein C0J52_25233, partial [Blattella germanica]
EDVFKVYLIDSFLVETFPLVAHNLELSKFFPCLICASESTPVELPDGSDGILAQCSDVVTNEESLVVMESTWLGVCIMNILLMNQADNRKTLLLKLYESRKLRENFDCDELRVGDPCDENDKGGICSSGYLMCSSAYPLGIRCVGVGGIMVHIKKIKDL